MADRPLRCVTLGDFNLETLNGVLQHAGEAPDLEVVSTDFGQVQPVLMNPNAAAWSDAPDVALIWTRPEAQIHSFQQAADFHDVDPEAVLDEVDAFANAILQLKGRVATVLVPAWTTAAYDSGLGLLDARPGLGLAHLLWRMNQRLTERLSSEPGFFVLDTAKWLAQAGRNASNPKLWYMAKVAFSNEVLKTAAREIRAALLAIGGQSRKLVILDLDNTLWGGLVGEDGWEQLVLGGHDPLGEAFVDFQSALKALTRRGILLGLVSKNEESTALEAIDKHPEMVLRREDFVGWRINWQDKAQNVQELVAELNLGLQSVVFIDDMAHERARVREALPEVLVPEWPEDTMLYRQALLGLRCFDSASLGREDRKRAEMYAVERERRQSQTSVGSLDDWLQSLELRIEIEALTQTNLARAAQLLNKTNQMNLSTRRMPENELWEWASGVGRQLWTLRVSDRFGDLGLVGLLSVESAGDGAQIVDFVLSCRAFSRGIEETMLAKAMQHAQASGLASVRAVLLPTKRNKPCREFWERSGFEVERENSFVQKADAQYAVPRHVTLAGGF